MRVFVTGATGFIGSVLVKELIAAGHQVLGLCRTPEKAAALAAAGAEVHRGDIEDLDSLKAGAAQADGVVHLAFNHDFSRFAQNAADDRQAILALGAALAGSARPLIVTSGTAIANTQPGRPAHEDDPTISPEAFPRVLSEQAALALRPDGVKVSVVRLPQVHDTTRQGLITLAIQAWREQGACAYVGDGSNRWPAAHVSDVARLYRLALERPEPGVYHAVAEEGVALRDIAEAVGQRLGLPVRSISENEAEAVFGWLARFAAHDMPASSAQTRRQLGWEPTGPGLLADLERLELPDA